MELCKHGGNPAWCSFCNPKSTSVKIRKPKESKDTSVYGSGAEGVSSAYSSGYAVVQTNHKNGLKKNYMHLSCDTTYVHIDGQPFIWAFRLLIEYLPKLQTIQIVPTQERHLSSVCKKLCDGKKIKIVKGYHRPDLAWAEGENRSPYYTQQQLFLLNLQGEQKTLFDELLQLDFAAAQFVARYFCLKGEEFKPQHKIALEFDLVEHEGLVSLKINGVLFYLDPSFNTGKTSERIARGIRMNVLRLREILSQTSNRNEVRNEIAKSLGLEELPDRLPMWMFPIFKEVVVISQTPLFEKLRQSDRRGVEILELRYGIKDGVYHTLAEVGEKFGELSRQRVQQIEESMLSKLGISSD